MVRILVFLGSVVFLISGAFVVSLSAQADCPGDYGDDDDDTVDCDALPYDVAGADTVCRDCDSGGNDYVCCYGPNGSYTKDVIVLIEDGSGDPYAYGTIDVGGTDTKFCCDGTDMGTTSAVDVEIYMDNDDDVICLLDGSVGSCLNEIVGLQMWDAPAYVEGGRGDDEIHTCPSGAYSDEVLGENGHDTIYTYDGVDDIDGGIEHDTIDAGDGNDTVDGGDGNDNIVGGSGEDTLLGGPGIDTMRGGGDGDTVDGGTGADYVYGGSGSDDVRGGQDADYIGGDGGDDCLCGGEHGTGNNDDTFADTLNGNVGSDTCYYYDAEGDTVSNCTTEYDLADCYCP